MDPIDPAKRASPSPRVRAWELAQEAAERAADARLSLLARLLRRQGTEYPGRSLAEIDALIQGYVEIAVADYFEQYELWPINKPERTAIFLAFYEVAAKTILNRILRPGDQGASHDNQ